MEKERFFANPDCPNWQPAMNCGGVAEQLPFFNLNWDQSALSSLVSSPASASPPAADGVVMRELIGRLGTICNSGEISPPMSCVNGNATASTSCYNSPLNSPPKLNLPMMDQHHWQLLHPQSHGGTPAMHSAHMAPFSADPGFAERAARFSCFGGRNYNALPGQFGLPEAGNISRVSSSQSLKATGSQVGISERGRDAAMPIDGEFKNSSGREESSVSDPNGGPGDSSNPRKRKGAPKGKGKETPLSSSPKDSSKVEDEDSSAKRSRSTEGSNTEKDVANKPKVEQHGSTTTNGYGGQKQGKENHAKPPEPPKDYIHVRARRGQATDSHSLAERVRREKISERMKFLQDLVPGCNKVTGKAVMLDEIINYVQSLQKQVEFLSMKLATVNPRADFNMDSFLPKDIHQPRGPLTHLVYPMETAAEAFSYVHQPQQGTPLQSVVTNGLETQCSVKPLDPNLRQTLCMQLPALDGFGEAASQLGNFWEDDLQSVVQMGFVQNQEAAFSSQSFHGSVPTAHMKIEL